MFELIFDTDSEDDEEVEESSYSDSEREDVGPTTEEEDPATRDEGLAARDDRPNMGVESRGLDDESHGSDDVGHSVESDGFGLGEEEVIPKSVVVTSRTRSYPDTRLRQCELSVRNFESKR
nr:hypothetical protein [Tanacetum cinerariifolium]